MQLFQGFIYQLFFSQKVGSILWEEENCDLLYFSAVMLLYVSWISFRLFWQLLKHKTGLLLVHFWELFRSGSGFWKGVSFSGDVYDFTLLLFFDSGEWVFSIFWSVVSLWILADLNFLRMSPEVAAAQPLGLVEVLCCSGRKAWRF